MRTWTRACRMLATMAMVLSLCSHSLLHVAATTDLDILEDVLDALHHADRSLNDLTELLEAFTTEEPPDTTATETSTSTTTTTTTAGPTTTTTTPEPTTTTLEPTTTTPEPTTTTTLEPTTTTPEPTTTTLEPTTTKSTTTTSSKETTNSSNTSSALQALALPRHSPDAKYLNKQRLPNEADPDMPDPWWMRVNMHLIIMGDLISEIIDGSIDESHAQQLEEEASVMDDLVEEGWNDTSLVMEGEVDLNLVDSVVEDLFNASNLVEEMISDEKADNTEMMVTIVMLSVLFVVVLTGLIIACVSPWTKRSGLRSSQSKWVAESAVAQEGSRKFRDARFMQHSHIYTDPYQNHDTKV